MLLPNLIAWHQRVRFPNDAAARLGFGYEYWDLNPDHYEGAPQLSERYKQLGRKRHRRQLACDLASHLLDDVLVAAGGIERACALLAANAAELESFVVAHSLVPKGTVPMGLGHEASANAWYAFADVLAWSRALVERLDRPAGNRRHTYRQGLIPAIRPKRLRKRCESLLVDLRGGPVGQSRLLTNFMVHSALVSHPFSGVRVAGPAQVILPIPDLPVRPVSHWYHLTWDHERDGFALAREIWESTLVFMDGLLVAFERSVPRRLRK